MKRIVLALAAAVALLAPSASSTLARSAPTAHTARKAPNVRCMRLDRAERKLRRLGFRIREHGGGIFGIIVRADWVVVYESQRGNTVHLTAGRSC